MILFGNVIYSNFCVFNVVLFVVVVVVGTGCVLQWQTFDS